MKKQIDLLLTALAPTLWGTTYIVLTAFLPQGYPLTMAMLRALPAGLLLLIITRKLPKGIWILRIFVLAILNFSLFWWLLFVAAYHLPGGIAATIGAIQPMIVLILSYFILHQKVSLWSYPASFIGFIGVGLLIISPSARLDTIGIIAALGATFSMGLGTVLTKYWQPKVPPLTFASWQLTMGGLILLPFVLLLEPSLPHFTIKNWAGITYLSIISAAFTYILWFRGIARLGPAYVTPLTLLSPVTAVILGALLLNETLNGLQILGVFLVFTSVILSQVVLQKFKHV